MKINKKSLIIILVILLGSVVVYGVTKIKIPPLDKPVTDLTQTLNSYEVLKIGQNITEFDSAKGVQILVLLIPTTKNETIDEYAKRVFKKWKTENKEAREGAILVIAQNDRELTIEVSSGLNETITRNVADYIIDEYILPEFRNSNFSGGIENGINKIMTLINGGDLIEYKEDSTNNSGTANNLVAVIILIFAFLGVSSTLITGKKFKLFILIFLGSLILSFVGGMLLADSFVGVIFTVVALIFGVLLRLMICLSIRYGTKTSNTDTYSSGSWTSSSASTQKLGNSSVVNGSEYNDNNGTFKGGGASGSW